MIPVPETHNANGAIGALAQVVDKGGLDFVLKGHGFSRAVSAANKPRL